tara:strand:- start:174 stop:440 length:267 start_codon:yes stop_codon:yes gene_type:complete
MANNKNNNIIAKKLQDVNYCLAELAQRGLSIVGIEIRDRKPVITIDSYHKEPGGLKGGFLTRISEHGRHWETYATEVQGCQVEWRISA